ncbi:MAG: hypothetical protein Q4F84_06630 [Fibrobacter sp.]|nr:hypothetical protein [Fibrobacter sp.]
MRKNPYDFLTANIKAPIKKGKKICKITEQKSTTLIKPCVARYLQMVEHKPISVNAAQLIATTIRGLLKDKP